MTAQAFVEFDGVWLAYDDALLAAGTFAVEDISLSARRGTKWTPRSETANRKALRPSPQR